MAAALLGWLYISAQVFALARMGITGTWRLTPCFWAFLCVHAVQAFRVTTADSLLPPFGWRWVPVERWVVVLGALAVIECAFRLLREFEPVERNGMMLFVPLPVFATYIATPWQDPSTFEGFLQLRLFVWSAGSLILCSLAMFLTIKPLRRVLLARYHLLLLCGLFCGHAFIAPLMLITGTKFLQEQSLFRALSILLCLGWAFSDPRQSRILVPVAEDPLRLP